MPFGQITLSWNQNVEADLAGYQIYCGTSPLTLAFLQDVGLTATPSTPSVTISSRTNTAAFPNYGTLYFAVTAYDTAVPPNVSTFSGTVNKGVAPVLFPMVW